MIVLFGSVLVLDTYRATLTVQAQADPNAPAAPHNTYLPLISLSVPTPISRIKQRSGLHLGNRNSSDWRQELFTNISTATVTSTWPAAVTVQSDQLYNLYRYLWDESHKECRIAAAGVKETGAHEPYNLYHYLTAAVHAGTLVVIRITPSPGNFIDYAQPGGSRAHTLLATAQPAGGNYCGTAKEQEDKIHQYRDIQEMAEEMQAIYQVNIDARWPPTSFFFEPANEPNQEWYVERRPPTSTLVLDPDVNDKRAWIEMDDYFAALYDQAKKLQPTLQILSPSISQSLYGEHYVLGGCTKVQVDGDSKNRSGIDFMKKTFGYDPDAADPFPTPKADGFAWHNYWRAGHEAWEPILGPVPSIDFVCAGKPLTDTTVITSDHVIQYFSEGMLRQIGPRPTFITEADRKSPCQAGIAGAAPSKDADPAAIRDSLLRFTSEEVLGRYVIAWLLVNQDQNEADTCRDAKGHLHQNYENNWHEAYAEDSTGVHERNWFHLWWPAAW